MCIMLLCSAATYLRRTTPMKWGGGAACVCWVAPLGFTTLPCCKILDFNANKLITKKNLVNIDLTTRDVKGTKIENSKMWKKTSRFFHFHLTKWHWSATVRLLITIVIHHRSRGSWHRWARFRLVQGSSGTLRAGPESPHRLAHGRRPVLCTALRVA